jgi:hypothetical protein
MHPHDEVPTPGTPQGRYDYLPLGEPLGTASVCQISQRYGFTSREGTPATGTTDGDPSQSPPEGMRC